MAGPIALLSAQFPSVCLRLDGSGVTQMTASGGGNVNCQFASQPGPWEILNIVPQSGGRVAFASTAFPNVVLRMDGQGVSKMTAAGGGRVNAQFGVGSWEQFYIRKKTKCAIAIESAAFPNVFLRLDGSGMKQALGSGGGIVNCQFGFGAYELFYPIEIL